MIDVSAFGLVGFTDLAITPIAGGTKVSGAGGLALDILLESDVILEAGDFRFA